MNRTIYATATTGFQAFIVLIVSVSTCYAAEINGKLRLNGSGSKSANIADAIVYFLPDDPSVNLATSETGAEIPQYHVTMARKQFVPRTQVVAVGSKVLIPNKDSISHNAFSLSPPNNFDLDLYGRGKQKEFEVKGPGVVRIYCNVHFHMVAYVLALETPYHTQPDSRGNFNLNIPDVPGQIIVWHDRTSKYKQRVNPGETNFIDKGLRITKRRLPAHNNKYGRSYRRARP